MKKLLIFIMTLTFSFAVNSQIDKIDTLIDGLNNNQLYGTCNYAWVLKMDSSSADSLVNIGKSVSNKLIPFLDSSDKGIIAHCVLSRIWIKDFSISTSFENFEEKEIVEYNYNGLPFYEKDGIMIADEKILSDNKKKWIETINQ
ncbi:hypothetical protein ACFQ1R_13090 [Mariniflexile jejuense]|uniref:Uncharacterized protein n=1 Tax=Mariniflexile jejuense TaxID=1173582 RepID=A0ABW3JP13_9FLAO